MQKGYIPHGEKDEISIRKPNNDTVLVFDLHTQDPNIYWLNAEIVKDEKSLSNLVLSAHSYDLWHECPGHPSQMFYDKLVGTPLACPVMFIFPMKFLYVGVAHKER